MAQVTKKKKTQYQRDKILLSENNTQSLPVHHNLRRTCTVGPSFTSSLKAPVQLIGSNTQGTPVCSHLHLWYPYSFVALTTPCILCVIPSVRPLTASKRTNHLVSSYRFSIHLTWHRIYQSLKTGSRVPSSRKPGGSHSHPCLPLLLGSGELPTVLYHLVISITQLGNARKSYLNLIHHLGIHHRPTTQLSFWHKVIYQYAEQINIFFHFPSN